MKFGGKKAVALVIALMMCSAMVTGFATEPAITITSVRILDSASAGGTNCPNFRTETVSLSAAQMLQVTATVANVEDAQISFMSYISSATDYTDATIQYLDQKPASSGTATFTFRPRIEEGTFVAMTGATSVALADSFNYIVVPAAQDMTVTGSVTYPVNAIKDTVLTITEAIEEITAVAIDNVSLTAVEDYTVETDADKDTTTITIKSTAIPADVGTHTVKISADGYNDGKVTIKITEAEIEIDDEQTETAEEEVKAAAKALAPTTVVADDNTETYVLSLNSTPSANVTDENNNAATIKYEVNEATMSKGMTVDEVNNLLVFDPSTEGAPFVGKAEITAKFNSDVASKKVVYFVPTGVTISYGNITAVANSEGKDGFDLTQYESAEDADAAFVEWVNANENEIKVEAKMMALAIGAGRADEDTIATYEDTLDFNRNEDISLNEYNIYRKMILGFDGFGITAVNEARDQY